MRFQTSAAGVSFEIPDDWWLFAEMERFTPSSGFYPYSQAGSGEEIEIVSLSEVEPPRRAANVALFKKYKLVPVFFAFLSPECALPPVMVNPIRSSVDYRFEVHNGLHRYYTSAAVGYSKLPVIIRQSCNLEVAAA